MSEAAFDKFINGRMLVHATMVTVPHGKKGGTREDVKDLKVITSLSDALAAQKVEGTFLELRDAALLLGLEVSNLKGFRNNQAKAFEELSNKAIAIDKHLLEEFNGKLEPLNGGKNVVFSKMVDGELQDILECDGLIKNSSVVLLNEAKSKLHKADISNLVADVEQLKGIMKNPDDFVTRPAGILEELNGLTVVPIASCFSCDAAAVKACQDAHIHLLQANGQGFTCQLHRKPASI